MFRIKTIFFFVCLLLCKCFHLLGQNPLQPSAVQVVQLGVKQGLSQGMVNSIIQDKEGYMWIATKDGLNRYDGYEITIYRNNPNNPYSLPNNYCSGIVEDEKGNFWVGTNSKGLFLFDKRTERFYPVTAVNKLEENLIIRELKYAEGKLYLESLSNAVIVDISQVDFLQNPNTIGNAKILFSYKNAFPTDSYKSASFFGLNALSNLSICLGIRDSVYLISSLNSPSSWNKKVFPLSAFGLQAPLNRNLHFFSLVNEPDIVIVAHKNTIQHFNSKSGKTIFSVTLPAEKEEVTKNFFQGNDGNIYRFSKFSGIVYKPATKEIEKVNLENFSIYDASLNSLFIDFNGNQWFGTNGLGLIIKDPRKENFKSYKGAQPSSVFQRLSTLQMPQIPLTLNMPREFAYTSLDKQGIYWTLFRRTESNSNQYLQAYNTQTRKVNQFKKFNPSFNFLRIHNDAVDRLWVYFQDGKSKNYIGRIEKSTGALLASYEIPDVLESAELYVMQFYLDEKGILWLTTINGLYAFDESTNKWQHWKNNPTDPQSLSANELLSICPDPYSPEKYLWIGTEGAGLNRFDKTTGLSIRYGIKDGLPNEVINCMLVDSLQNIWISTNNGLSCFDPKHIAFRNFSGEDGLPGNEFNRTSGMILQNGELMFGGVEGIVVFKPQEVLQKQSTVPIVFTGISILNKAININTDSVHIKSSSSSAKRLVLKPGENIFSVRFACLEYRDNSKKLYKYKLEGFDREWTNPNPKNEVTYTNLSPGKYTFYVMGANTDGVWNETPIRLDVFMQPYWYQTLLFKIIAILLIASAVYAFYQYRLRQKLKIEKLRNRIARDLHDEIGSTLSSISIYAASAQKVAAGNQKAEGILAKINVGTTEMMEAMSDIVWAVNTGNEHFNDLANRLRSFSVQVTEEKNIELQFTDNKDIPETALDMEQRKNIYLICKEAISNAVKYADCSLLQVLISKKQNNLHIQIQDNGKSFLLENNEAVSSGHSFGGNGIKNMKNRAVEIGAHFEISSALGVGTTVFLDVPLKKS